MEHQYDQVAHLQAETAGGALLVTLHLAPAFVTNAFLGVFANQVLAAAVPKLRCRVSDILMRS